MKKFLKITAVVLLSLLIFFVGTFKYRQYKANQILIPKNTSILVKISIDEIYKTLAANMIAHPGYYFKSHVKKDSLAKKDKFDHGLAIPASVYFYTLSDQPKTTLFTRLEVKDIKKFENFLRSTLRLQIIKKEKDLNTAKSRLGNLEICYNSKSAAIALATQIENYEPILTDILNQKGFNKIEDSQFESLLSNNEHFAFASNENTGWIDFKTGKIAFSNEVLTNNILAFAGNKHRKLSDNATISFWSNANFKPIKSKNYKFKNFSLAHDSLLKYYNGNLDFEWTNSIQKTDSVITYEYNDDFEKVEKVSLQKRNIPSFSLNINTKTNGLKNYLAKQGLINLDSNIINKNAFPLYKVFVSSKADHLNFSTEKLIKGNNDEISSEDLFYLNIDFVKLTKQLDIPMITNYLNAAKRLEVKGKLIEPKKISINGTIELKNEEINSLYQILKRF